ncbi:MAG: hypothetical protein ACJZ48_04760 [Candidatus Pelagibacterales bacterium]|jgi:hypothetical protein|tara:strand:+ start:89 stop:391 length:303 start_codon:yes stop_codon:yes gene_type:complete
MTKLKKLTIVLLFSLISACGGGNTINDIKTLEQKALEIPPNFDLKPPSDNDEIKNQSDISSESQTSDLNDILETNTEIQEEKSSETDGELLDILIGDSTN